MMIMYNSDDLIREFMKLPRGRLRMEGIQYAITQADLAKDYPYMFYFRYKCTGEAVHCNNNAMYFFLLVPEMQKLLDEHPDMEIPCSSSSAAEMLLWAYNNMLSKAVNYYQIPLLDIESFLLDYKRIALKYGFPLLDYYENCTSVYECIDTELSMKNFEAFKRCRKKDATTCWSCDQKSEIYYELFLRGNEKRALKLAKPLYRPENACDNAPFAVLGYFMSFYLSLGNMDEASVYYDRLQTALKQNKYKEKQFAVGDSLLFLAKTNPKKAWRFYKKQSPVMGTKDDPCTFFHFARGAATLMAALEGEGRETIPLSLPKDSSLYREDGCYATSLLRQYYENQTQEIARKFDQRNGTDYYAKLLNGSR